jgi:hypothetical protein
MVTSRKTEQSTHVAQPGWVIMDLVICPVTLNPSELRIMYIQKKDKCQYVRNMTQSRRQIFMVIIGSSNLTT